MSYKYKFILSFVLLELFFIVIIVSLNFIAIDSSSKELIKNKINSNMTFLEELAKVPLSVFDLATLDELVVTTKKLKYINSIIILNKDANIISKQYNYPYENIDDFIEKKRDRTININGDFFQVKYAKIMEDDILLGQIFIIFDITENKNFIKNNKTKTIAIVFLEIIISTFFSYLLGSGLTRMLTRLAKISKRIANREEISIPYLNKKDEIGILSNSMDQMYKRLNEYYINLKQLTIIQDKQKKDLEEANKSKDDFLANMSHELKTPLNSINVISSVMMKNRNNTLNEDQIKNLTIINQCGNDLLFLINDVLDISKLESGEMKLVYETFELKEAVKEVYNMFKPQTDKKAIDFKIEYNIKTQAVYSDKQRLKQVIKNLLSNSIKFVSNGYIKLIANEDKENFIISVEDTGVGIPKEKLEKIFDRFKQADSTTTRKYGGTGLGLSICKELCTLLKGTIEVQSKVNEKTTFKITLPKNEDKISNKKDIIEDTKKEISHKILILNNDPISLMSFIIELKEQYQIEQVTAINDLIKKEESENYQYIIINDKDSNINDLNTVIAKYGNKTILISEKENKDLENKIKLVLQKPLDTKNAISKINNIKI